MFLINSTIQSEMLLEFENERQDCLKIIQSIVPISQIQHDMVDRARNRLLVIQQSVDELKKQMVDPLRHITMKQGCSGEIL